MPRGHASLLMVALPPAAIADDLCHRWAACGQQIVGLVGSMDEAVAHCRRSRPDCICLVADGAVPRRLVEDACWLRATLDVPVLLAMPDAGFANLELLAHTHALGCVVPPFAEAQLRAALDAVLGFHHGQMIDAIARQVSASNVMGVVVTRPEPPDYPIIHVNAQFERITGYTADEVRGRCPRFLHGEGTAPAALRMIKEAVEARRSCEVVLLNYRKDGTPFWNGFSLLPVHDETGAVRYLVGRVTDVSGLVAQKEALAASQARLLETQRIARLGHWEWDAATDGIVCSEEVSRIFGVSQGVLPTTLAGLLERVHPDDRARVAAAMRGGPAFELDHRVVWADGRARHVHTCGEGGRTAAERRTTMLGTMQDITERHQARADLAVLVSQLSATLEATADGIIVVNREHQIVRYNRRFVEMAGLTPEQQRIKDVRDLRAELFRRLKNPEEAEVRTRAIVETAPNEHRDRLEFKDGRIVERYSCPQRVGGEVVGRVVSFRDITDLVRAEERLAGIFAQADDAIITTDAKQRIVLFNRGAERIFGHRAEDILGQPLGRLIPEDKRGRHAQHVESFAAGPVAARAMSERPVEIFGLRANGEIFPADVSISKIRLGGELLFTAILRDISARRVMEEQRARLEAELRQVHKMEALGTFAGGVAHDFNNIITGIDGFAMLAADDVPAGSAAHEALQSIRAATRRASDLVQQILAFGRKGGTRLGQARLSTVVAEVVKLVRVTLPAGVELEVDVPEEDTPLMLDTTQIFQVLMNLCKNALDALGPQGGRIVLRSETAELAAGASGLPAKLPPGRYLLLTVEDNGVGMDAATRERIFEPFFTTKDHGRGTGLGLAVVHGIMQVHGGSVQVQSALGHGTRFTLYFPRPPAA
ncbi:MAG: hypothetical protein C0502_10000 [Opitutus sp.]|nr:hypothetical protein [Opitutus sp.]